MALLTSTGHQVCPRIMSPSVDLVPTPVSVPCNSEAAKMDDFSPDCASSDDDFKTDQDLSSATFKEVQKPSCCRKLIHEFEKELTFHPKLNPSSLKMANHKRHHQPLLTRLTEGKRKPQAYDQNLTFSPKLNATSVKLAQERAGKMDEIQSKATMLNALKMAEFYSEYTFKPSLLSRSMRIVERLDTDFISRQKLHITRRQQLTNTLISPPQKKNLSYSPLSNYAKNKNFKGSTATTPLSTPKQLNMHQRALRRRTQTAPIISLTNVTLATQKSNNKVALERQGSEKSLLLHKATQNKTDIKAVPSQDHYQGLLQVNFKSLSETDRIRRVKVMAEKVTRAKKIFQIKGGYQTVRKALKSRGWAEVDYHQSGNGKSPSKKDHSHSDSDDSCDDSDNDDDSETESEEETEEYLMLCRAIRNCEPNFIWSLRRNDLVYNYLKKDQTVNHFSGAWFTTKYGLCNSLKDLHWYGDINPDTFFPRCYCLSDIEDKEAFTDDYKFTTAFSVLKLVACELNYRLEKNYCPVSEIDSCPNIVIMSNNNHLPSASPTPSDGSATPPCSDSSTKNQTIVSEEIVYLSIKAGEFYLAGINHDDIDGSTANLYSKPEQNDWDKILTYYRTLMSHNSVLYCTFVTATKAEELLIKLSEHCPQLSMDGIRNIWIIKPGAMSRGRGIVCMDNLEDILSFVHPSALIKDNRWVVQKYIERPLLIYSTKFDIRQWFLVTDWNPLTMWMYKDCYMRFSSQLFSLEKMDKSIHLCNNSIQKHLTNSQSRDPKLPSENMWDSNMFQLYLESIGKKDKWSKVIYPGMKQAIISVLQVAQDRINDRKNTFELFGADFMITSDFNPWLIEINCSPTMERNTSVTKRLCKNVMEDTIKVIIDRRNSGKDCDTGQFELAYKQTKMDSPPYIGLQLHVEGCGIKTGGLWKSRNCTLSLPTVNLNHSF